MFVYRKELDGLRALSVIAVIVYHAHLELSGIRIFKGGFFGVDIFLVLSGYLITEIIRERLKQNSFSFLDFYWRRTKRIVPGLLAVLAVTSALAYLILLPDELITYAKSLQSALYFNSNYFFYREDSYIADASIYKPLLHTWTLAVEWQFYLIYPIIIWFLDKYLKKYLFAVLVILTLLSLQYANFIVTKYPDEAFYLLPARFWELALGGLVTFYNREQLTKINQSKLSTMLHQSLPIFGLFIIVFSMLFIDDHMQHPSFITLIPVLGACLLLMFSHKNEFTNRLLSKKSLVFIGLISYSLYLWHQPIFVFFRLLKHDYIQFFQLLLLTTVSIILAFITYTLVESSYRKKQIGAVKISIMVFLLFALALFSHLVVKNKAYFDKQLAQSIKNAYEIYRVAEFRRLQDRVNIGSDYYKKPLTQCSMRTVETACKFGDQSWLTLGDSYVGQFDFTLKERLEKSKHGMISFAYEQCPFVSPEIWFKDTPECTVVNSERFKAISAFDTTKNIIVTADYSMFSNPKRKINNPTAPNKKNFQGGNELKDNSAWKSYADNIKWLLDKGHTVYVIYPVPNSGGNVKQKVFLQLRSSNPNYITKYSRGSAAFDKASDLSKKLDRYLTEHPRLHKVYPTQVLCDKNRCKIIDQSGGLYNNGSHLSYIGAKILLDSFMPY